MNFLQKYQQLVESQPAPAFYGGRNEGCQYVDNIWHSFNTYHSFDGGRLRASAYMYDSTGASYNSFCVDCFDCDHCNTCERCSECFSAFRCYDCSYLESCEYLTESHFCVDCKHSQNLFGCVGLNHKKCCIFNRQYSKNKYYQKLKELKNKSAQEILQIVEKIKTTLPQAALKIARRSENSLGDYVLDCKNCYFCFFTTECQDSAYLFSSQFSKDCFDGNLMHMCELCYQCPSIGHSYNCSYSTGDYLTNCHYCTYCFNSKNLFGCVNLKHAKYCILNQQYSKKEYLAKVKKIKKDLRWKT